MNRGVERRTFHHGCNTQNYNFKRSATPPRLGSAYISHFSNAPLPIEAILDDSPIRRVPPRPARPEPPSGLRPPSYLPPVGGSATTFGSSALGISSLNRSSNSLPSAVSMNGANTPSKLKMPHSTAVIRPLTQYRKIELMATCPCFSAACSHSCFELRR